MLVPGLSSILCGDLRGYKTSARSDHFKFFSVGSHSIGVHVLVFRSELCILFCCFLSNTQNLLLYVRLQCHCALQLRMFP